MGGMGLIFTPVLVRCLLGPPGLSGLMTSTSRAHRTSKQSCWKLQLASSCPPATTSHSHLPPSHPPLVRGICDIIAVVKKFAQNPAVLDSYCR